MTGFQRKSGLGFIAHLLVAMLVALGLGLAAIPAQAAAPVTVKVKVTMSGPPATLLPAGDDKAHMVGLGQRTGKAVFSDGRKADYSNVWFLDLYRGKYAKTWGYTKMAFKDGSWLFFKWDSAVTGRDKEGNPTMSGTGTILKGAGTYQGIKGTAKFTNRRLKPSKELPKGGTEANAVFTYTLPGKK